jgi:hypothetical protein
VSFTAIAVAILVVYLTTLWLEARRRRAANQSLVVYIRRDGSEPPDLALRETILEKVRQAGVPHAEAIDGKGGPVMAIHVTGLVNSAATERRLALELGAYPVIVKALGPQASMRLGSTLVSVARYAMSRRFRDRVNRGIDTEGKGGA